MAHASKEIFSSADCRRRLGHRGRRLRPKDADTTGLTPSPPQRSAQEAGSGPAPKLLDIDCLGRLRAEFYNKSSERRRTSSSPRMPYVSEVTVKVRAQDLKPVEKKRGKEREHTHRHHSERRRRKKEGVDGGSDDERVDVDKVYTREQSEKPEGGGEGSSSAKREPEGDEKSPARDRRSSRHKDERRKRVEGIRERTSWVDGTKGYDRDHGSLRQSSSRSVRLRESSVRPKDSSVAASDLSRLTRSTSVREPPSSTSQLPLRRSNTTTSRARSSSRRPTSAMPSIDAKAKDKSGGRDGRDHKNSSLLAVLFGFQSPPRVPDKMVECVACMCDSPASKAAKLPCNHIMCHDCLSRIFTLSVTDPQHMPPKCCTQDHIPLKHVDRLFNDKFKHLWNQKYQEFTTKNRIYCPTKACGEWIKPANIHTDTSGGPGGGRKYGKCSRCKTKVCCLCNGKWHVGKDCPRDEETKRFVEIAKKAGWQRCYNCSAMVELKEGCNHMTCYDQADVDPMPFAIPPFRVAGRNRRQPLGQALNHNQGFEQRREQERADEELARRLQTIDLANFDIADGQFGVGNENFARIAAEIAAGGEALNQAMRNHIRPAQRQQRDRNHGVPGNRQQFAPPPPPPPSPPPFPPIEPYRHPSPQPRQTTNRHRPRIPTNPTFDSPPRSYHSDYREPAPRTHAAAPPLRPTLHRRGGAAYGFGGGSDDGDFDDEFVGRAGGRGGWEEDEGEGYGYLLGEDRRRTRRVGAWLDEVPDEDVLV